MKTDEEYSSFVSENFKNFSLDLTLCSPSSLGITREQFFRVLTQLQDVLPPHLKELPLLMLSLQASYDAPNDNDGNNRLASIQVFTPHSKTVMLSLEVRITDVEIVLENVAPRELGTIRKTSLYGDDKQVIMIVDDEFLMRSVLSRWVKAKMASVEIILCRDGLEAVEKFKSNFYLKLIVMDIQMPNLSGDEATRQIRTFERSHGLYPTPIIGVTASNIGKSLIEDCGMTDFCAKPIHENEFISKLGCYLDVKDSLQEDALLSSKLECSQDVEDSFDPLTTLSETNLDDTGEDDTFFLSMK